MPDDLPVYRLAKEYGQSPAQVRQWDAKEFDRACDIYVAEHREKWPADGSERIERKPMANNGFILDRDFNFWRRFIVGGELDKEALLAKGYSKDQLPDIRKQIKEAGLLGEEAVAKVETPPHQTPHAFEGKPDNWCTVCGKSQSYYIHSEEPLVALPPEHELPEGFPKKEELSEGGLVTLAQVRAASREDLIALKGIGPKSADEIIAAASL